jgi:hypothetical protein
MQLPFETVLQVELIVSPQAAEVPGSPQNIRGQYGFH